MFDRFTERARRVMVFSRIGAQKAGHDCIGTEDILMGIVLEASGVGAQALKNLGVDPARVRTEVDRIVKKGNHPASGSQLPFTMGCKHVLEFAFEEAQDLGHKHIGTEHLLLGVLREETGPGAQVLRTLGQTIVPVRDEVVRLIAKA
jgi:ATP-dependent Clp protease ATP-binding subunit ClpC